MRNYLDSDQQVLRARMAESSDRLLSTLWNEHPSIMRVLGAKHIRNRPVRRLPNYSHLSEWKGAAQ